MTPWTFPLRRDAPSAPHQPPPPPPTYEGGKEWRKRRSPTSFRGKGSKLSRPDGLESLFGNGSEGGGILASGPESQRQVTAGIRRHFFFFFSFNRNLGISRCFFDSPPPAGQVPPLTECWDATPPHPPLTWSPRPSDYSVTFDPWSGVFRPELLFRGGPRVQLPLQLIGETIWVQHP